MSIDRMLRIAFTSCVLLLAMPATGAEGVSQQLAALDAQLLSGSAELQVSRYAAPAGKPPRYGTTESDRATLLFERPDRFKLVLRPGKQDERQIVAAAGLLRWRDAATNTSGQSKTEVAIDPFAFALLGVAGELTRFATLEDLPMGKKQPLAGAHVAPRVHGTRVATGTVWSSQDALVGFETVLEDGSRVFLSILSFKPNVETTPGDFEL